jgi:hypothetical protein
LFTRSGELWVGTAKGAGRFDGKRFQTVGSERALPGQSIRRIAEDPDGTLWFVGDGWPFNEAGALTCLRGGRWTSFTNLPATTVNQPVNYFRSKSGQQFVIGRDGVAEKKGEVFVPLSFPEAGQPCWFLEEDDKDVVGLRPGALLRLHGKKWDVQRIPLARMESSLPLPLLVTRDHRIYSCFSDGVNVRIYCWEGNTFKAASAPLYCGVTAIEQMREAPDGALWVLGEDLLARCNLGAGEWREYLALPPPVLAESAGGVIFAEEGRAYRFAHDQFEVVRDYLEAEVMDRNGAGWKRQGQDILQLKSGRLVQTYGPEETGIPEAAALALDSVGTLWVAGYDAQRTNTLWTFDGKDWKRCHALAFSGQPYSALIPDPASGLWVFLDQGVVHVDDKGCESYPLSNQDAFPVDIREFVDSQGRPWISGHSGAFRLDPLTRSWEVQPELGSRNIMAMLLRHQETWLVSDSGGENGISLLRPGVWKDFRIPTTAFASQAADGTLFFGGSGSLYFVPPDCEGPPNQLRLLEGRRMTHLIKDQAGDLWLGARDANGPSVLRYHAGVVPPKTLILRADAQARLDHHFLAQVVGLDRFVPLREQKSFLFSWRFDRGLWTDFTAFPSEGIPVNALGKGRHRFEIRARNEYLQVDPSPAQWTFVVTSPPLQEQSWFKPAVAMTLLLVCLLAAVATERATRYRQAHGRLAQTHQQLSQAFEQIRSLNEGLERRVAERTAELEQTHKQLLSVSRQAGMAEVATGVLHNVGNVLNSVNVSASLLRDRIRLLRLANVGKAANLIVAHAHDLGRFLTQDEKGRQLPGYLAKLADVLTEEQAKLLEETSDLTQNVEHIKKIVAMQQSYAKVSGVTERVAVAEVVESALKMQWAPMRGIP